MLSNRKTRRRAEALARKANTNFVNVISGPKTRSSRSGQGHLRTALLGTAAAGALMIAQPQAAHAQAVPQGTSDPLACVTVGTTANCTGNLSGGVDVDGPAITTLNVNTLDQNIMPAAGVDGINFTAPGGNNITINSNTGLFEIVATGGGDGIEADVTGNGNIAITSIGNVTGGDDGIDAYVNGNGNINIMSTGNVTAGDDAIYAYVDGDGGISITSTGNITATGDRGIYAGTYGTGDVSITSIGNITSVGIGIDLDNEGPGNSTIVSVGNITTTGFDAHGIYGYAQEGDVNITSTGNITAPGANAFGLYGQVEQDGNLSITSTGDIIAGDRGIYAILDDGNGNINVVSQGNITSGEEGIYADIDDETGNITVVSTGNITSVDDGIYAAVQEGGIVSVTSTGNITTTGNGGHGIGAFIDDGLAPVNTVTVNSTGDITTSGNDAHGIYAYVDNGTGSTTVTSVGNIRANGADSDGVRTYTEAGTTATVTVSGGVVQGGSGAGAGVYLYSAAGGVSVLNNAATNLFALSGLAVLGGAGDETVNNTGTVTGNVDLGAGTNAFNNQAGGTFNSGMMVNLGAGNLLTNDGILSPDGVGTVATTNITGNVVQNAPGILLTTLDSTAQTADLVTVTGTANLAGNVQVNVINPAFGPQQQTIVTAAGGVTNNGLGLLASPALQASLLFPNANDVVLSTDIDFTAPGQGLNPNQSNLAGNINAILGAGTGGMAPIVLALLNGVITVEQYTNALDQLSPEAFLNTETATLFGGEEFTNNLLSCKVPGSGGAFIREGQCVWVRPEGRFFDRDTTANNIGYEEDTGGISAGGQVAIAPGWSAGFGIGYEYSNLDTDTGVESDSRRYSVGGALKYQTGNLLLAGAISGGNADFDMTRRITFGGLNLSPTSGHDVSYLAGQLRAAYLFSQGNWYAKPLVDLNLTNVDRDGVTEAGGGAANLIVGGGEETYFSVTPAIEFGAEFQTSDANVVIQPYLKAGVTFYEDDSNALTASFAGAPAGVGGFAISSEFDDTFADIEAGLTLLHDNGTSLSFGYEGRISDNSDQHGFFGKGTAKF